MSLNCTLVLASDECVHHLAKHPAEVDVFVWGDHPVEPKGFISQLLVGRPVQTPRQNSKFCRVERDECYLDGAWHGLQFLLTASSWDESGPLNFFVSPGTPLNEDATIVGLSSFHIREVNAVVSQIMTLELAERFDPNQMTTEEIYPFSWERPDALEWLLTSFTSFQNFIRKASEEQSAIIRAIC